MSATPLCIDATIVGPIVELRYASHTEAFKQLYALRRALEANAQLLAALRDARATLAVAIRAAWDGCSDDDIAGHITIKTIDDAIRAAEGEKP